jgi:hypothetical protein
MLVTVEQSVKRMIARAIRSARAKPALCAPNVPQDLTPGSNPGRRRVNPASSRSNCGMAKSCTQVAWPQCELVVTSGVLVFPICLLSVSFPVLWCIHAISFALLLILKSLTKGKQTSLQMALQK